MLVTPDTAYGTRLPATTRADSAVGAVGEQLDGQDVALRMVMAPPGIDWPRSLA
jgi:hypothetical protein